MKRGEVAEQKRKGAEDGFPRVPSRVTEATFRFELPVLDREETAREPPVERPSRLERFLWKLVECVAKRSDMVERGHRISRELAVMGVAPDERRRDRMVAMEDVEETIEPGFEVRRVGHRGSGSDTQRFS